MSKNQMRIKKEYETFATASQESNIKVSLVNEDITHWKGYIQGPSDTPYKGGLFQIDIKLPPQYPYKPPTMKFQTKIWHPNVSSVTGAICLDILKGQWSPALTIRTALLSLQALMCAPVPDDPQDAVVAKQYMQNFQLWKKTVEDWVKNYASPATYENKTNKLMEMGFTKDQAEKALMKVGWDQEKALEDLLSM